jgi:hypothetical protein
MHCGGLCADILDLRLCGRGQPVGPVTALSSDGGASQPIEQPRVPSGCSFALGPGCFKFWSFVICRRCPASGLANLADPRPTDGLGHLALPRLPGRWFCLYRPPLFPRPDAPYVSGHFYFLSCFPKRWRNARCCVRTAEVDNALRSPDCGRACTHARPRERQGIAPWRPQMIAIATSVL